MIKKARNGFGPISKDHKNNENDDKKPYRQLMTSCYSSFKKVRRYLKITQIQKHMLYGKKIHFFSTKACLNVAKQSIDVLEIKKEHLYCTFRVVF